MCQQHRATPRDPAPEIRPPYTALAELVMDLPCARCACDSLPTRQVRESIPPRRVDRAREMRPLSHVAPPRDRPAELADVRVWRQRHCTECGRWQTHAGGQPEREAPLTSLRVTRPRRL